MRKTLTQEYVHKVIHYDPDTGVFTWLEAPSNRVYAGYKAGFIKSNGYRSISVGGKSVHAHRLAFFYMEGDFPEADVDHINGIRDDNRWSNLRRATRSENMKNARRSKANTSGVTGVAWQKASGKWMASIRADHNKIHLGLFTDFNEAVAARKAAERKYKFHENHGGTRHV